MAFQVKSDIQPGDHKISRLAFDEGPRLPLVPPDLYNIASIFREFMSGLQNL